MTGASRCWSGISIRHRCAPRQVRVELFAAAPPAAEPRLRLALAAGVDEVVRLEAGAGPPDASVLGEALAAALGGREAPNLILCGDRGAAGGRAEVPAV